MSRIWGSRERSSWTMPSKESFCCCQKVRSTLMRICCVSAPLRVRLPPQVWRATTAGRMARSTTLLVASKPGQWRKEKDPGLLVSQMLGEAAIIGN